MASIKRAVKVLQELSRGTSKKAMYKTWCLYMTEDERQGFDFNRVYGYISKGKGGKRG